MLIHAGLFALSLGTRGTPDYMGVERADLTDALVQLFESEIQAQQLRLLGFACAVGALSGLFAWSWLELLARARGGRGRFMTRFGSVMACVMAIHLGFLVYSMTQHPQLYVGQARGWLDPLVELAVALPSWLLPALGVLVLGSFLAMVGWLAWRRAPTRLALALAAGGSAGALAAPQDPPRWPEEGPPNVLLIGVDSLRSDLVGDPDGPAPHATQVAAEGLHFTRVFPAVPRTMPSWASMLTGRYPHGHGIRHMFPGPGDPKRIPGALPEVLRASGYRTGVVSDSAGEVFTRMDLGFEEVQAPPFTVRSNVAVGGLKFHAHLLPYLVEVLEGRGFPELDGMERLGDPSWLSDRALAWIDRERSRPFFLTVFYSCGHFPFAAPAPWYARYTDPAYRGRSRFMKATMGEPPVGEGRAAEETHLRALYRGAVAASDAALGELLAGLDARGLRDRTLVVITSDHGETIYEHGLGVGHGDHLFGLGSLQVPLVIRGPGVPRARVDATLPSVDLAPTLLGRLGLNPPGPPPEIDGIDLLAHGADPTRLTDQPAFAETDVWFFPPETSRLEGRRIEHYGTLAAFRVEPGTTAIQLDERYADSVVMAKHRMLIWGDRKLLYMPTRDGVRWELYDPARDPGDTHDLAAAEPETLARLRSVLYGWMLQDPSMTRLGEFVVPRAALGTAFDPELPAQ
jgi:arylsulfatase A-like enzyme